MATQIKLRRDTYQNWFDNNPILGLAEPGYDTTNKKLKIGDGVTAWRLLPYFDDQETVLSAVAQNIVPSADNTYDLGSPTNQWRHVYTAGGSIYLDNIKLTNVGGKFVAKTVINPGEENEADDPEDSDATSEISGGGGGPDFYNLGNSNLTLHPTQIQIGTNLTGYEVGDEGSGIYRIDATGGGSTGGISFDGTYIYPTVDGNNLTLEVYRQNGVEGAGLFLDGDNGIARLQAKKSFNREIGGTSKTFYAGEGEGIISVIFAPNSDLYQRELFSRLANKFDGADSFEYNYQIPKVIVNSLTENIEANITNVVQTNPDRFDITVDQLPNSDPFTVNTLDIFYDFYNTVGFNVDTDTFGMSTDNDDITIRSGRDIDLLAADDILIKGGSQFDLEVRRNDNQDPVDGIQIKTIDDGENITNNWTFQFDGTLTLPGDLALPGGLATITTTNNGGDTEISTPGSIILHNSTGDWVFDNTGKLTLPVGGDIVDSNGDSVIGGGNQNIWIQTFESDTPATDIPGSATSVEYDSDGNIIALFVHYYSDNSGNNYTSLAKFTSTGEKLWQVRYAGIGAVDGWGVAVDSQNSFIYVTARLTDPTGYDKTTITQFNLANASVNWSKIYDFGYASTSGVIDAYDGDAVFVGYANTATSNQVTVVKISGVDGSVIWANGLDGQGTDEAYGMAIGPSGEVVVIGFMSQLGTVNGAETVYTDPVSNPNWTIGTTINVGQDFKCDVSFVDGAPIFTNIVDRVGGRTVDEVITTVNGASFGGVTGVDDMILKVGLISASSVDNHMLVAKYNIDGTLAWQKAVLFDTGFDCQGADADIDSLGNIYVVGQYQKDDGLGGTDTAMNLVKFDSSGVAQWSRRVEGDCDTFATSIVVGPDDYLYLSGIAGTLATSDFNCVIAKYQQNGQVSWQRLLDNVTTWSFAGGFYAANGGGSSIAVKNGYVAVSGGFGDPGQPAYAMIAQVDTAGTMFAVDNWDFKQASFSGLLSSDASDITVTNANKENIDLYSNITVSTFSPNVDTTNFLVPTIYRQGDASTGDITFSGVDIRGATNNNALGSINLVPNPALMVNGQYLEIYPTNANDAPHIHIAAGTGPTGMDGDLILGNDNHHVDINHSGEVRIRTFDSDTSTTYNWQFENDGGMIFPTLTVPISDNATPNGTGQTIKFSDPTQQAIIYGPASTVDLVNAERVIIQGAPGFAGTTGEGGDVYLWAGPGGDAGGDGGDIKIRAGRGQLTGGGGYLNFQAGQSGTGNGGYINIESGYSSTYGSGGNITVQARSGGQVILRTTDSIGNARDLVLNNAGTTTFPGAIVKSTIDKTGIDLGYGPATALSDATFSNPIVDGNYGPFTLSGVTFTVVVTSGVAAYTVTATTGNSIVGEGLGTLDAGDLGGTPGNTSNISVSAINQAFTALDLTKSVNKLTNGQYTLANGVEGQIMYLVPQTGITPNSVDVTVANYRIDGSAGTDGLLFPFRVFNNANASYFDSGAFCTLIFTDGAWQQSGGSWD